VLDELTVMLDDVVVYRGGAAVVHPREQDARAVCGVAFESHLAAGSLGSTATAAGAVRDVRQQVARAEAALAPGVHEWVKVLAAELRFYLSTVRDAFRDAVPPGLPAEVEDLAVQHLERDLGPRFEELIGRFDELPRRVPPDRMPAVRRYLKVLLQELLLPAPVFRQTCAKPLGLAADPVTVHLACGTHYQGEDAYAKFVNRMLCDLPVSRAVIARLEQLRARIERAAQGDGGPVHVLAVGAGRAEELRRYLASAEPRRPLAFSLLEEDAGALGAAQAALAPLVRRLAGRVTVEYLGVSTRQLIHEPGPLAALGRHQLIYSAGLLDGLRGDAARALVSNLLELLAPGGTLALGHLSPRCRSQGFLDGVLDWQVTLRDDDELLALAPAGESATVETDAAGVNRFLVVRR
jgi:hypothetical protein